jgi:hypothetical protein
VKREDCRDDGISWEISWKKPCVRQASRIEDIRMGRDWERDIVGMVMVGDGSGVRGRQHGVRLSVASDGT